MTSPLATRLGMIALEADEAKGRVIRADAALKNARAEVEEFERALRQLDHVLASEIEEAA